MSTDTAVVRDWLKALGALVAGSIDRKEAEQRLGAYVPLLADEFSTGAFCRASLAAVARECKFFPAYAEVVQHLSAWWREHRPASAAITGPPRQPPPRRPPATPEELAAVRRTVASLAASVTAPPLYRAAGKPAHFSDERLLYEYEKLGAEGNQAAAARAGALRDRLRKPA